VILAAILVLKFSREKHSGVDLPASPRTISLFCTREFPGVNILFTFVVFFVNIMVHNGSMVVYLYSAI
jgi:hypothetical protein